MKLRRAAALMMVSVMAFAATGCGGGDDTKDSSTSSADKQSAAAGTESGASDDASDEGSDDTSAASGDLKYADITLGEDYKDLIKAFGYCLTLWLACYNLKKFIDVETTKALGDLRTKLNDKEKKVIHTYLFPEEDRTSILKGLNGSSSSVISPPFENADLFDYIGTIELGAIMVKRGAITLDEFKKRAGD